MDSLPERHIVRHWWKGILPSAPGGMPWPDKPEEAALDAMRHSAANIHDGPLLVERLRVQYAGSGLQVPPRVEDLLHVDARTVTTGHQLCLAGGPAFTYYKILTAIHLAKRLEERWESSVIPVFWLASEDHDFDEVRRLWNGEGWSSWSPEQPSGGPVGRMSTAGLQPFMEDWCRTAGIGEVGLGSAGSGGQSTLSGAMRHWVHALFGSDAVVVIDGDDPALKARFEEVMRLEIEEGMTHDGVKAWDDVLAHAGFSPQVHARACNLFHLGEAGRHRLVKEAGGWKSLGGAAWQDESALLTEVSDHPAHFSPNALLRPVYQSMLLPDVAVVGGMAEVAYWLQLPGVFNRLELRQPVLVPRDGSLVLPKKWAGLMDRCGLGPSDWNGGRDQWEARWMESADAPDVNAWRQGLKRDAASAAAQLKAFDPALESGAQVAEAKMEKLLDRLEQQVMRSAKRKEGDGLARIARLDAWCRPDGALQERIINFFHLSEVWRRQDGVGESLPQALDLAFRQGHEIGEWRPLMHVIRQQEV